MTENALQAENDRLRAKLAKVEALADEWERDYPASRLRVVHDLRAALDDKPPEWRKLNCPVCGSGEEGDCLCDLAEAIARAEWVASGKDLTEGPWETIRSRLVIKALPEAAKQSGRDV